ncbi:Oxidoreductase ptaL [Drechslerella dactyloides]|uniref:Oxidoreductase ptaL n=1 Tax=Drechslerella dactyloides TaxID=74499 RepID=A0AAD6IT81_DREDA|nr:Oxidoreductase ptaL [Drechslerella dactyloides]
MAKTVAIVGAGFTGLPLAHKLLIYTAPKIKDGFKVILISPNSHFYWNLAATRGVVPGAIPDDKLFIPIEPAFAKYPAENFEFVLGKATRLDAEKNTVNVLCNTGTYRDISYDQLVIASGSSVANDLPFKSLGTHETTLTSFHALQQEIENAGTIVVAGAGPTGIETAGELATTYGDKKKVTLLVAGDRVLHSFQPLQSVSQQIEGDLKKLGVKLAHNAKVQGAEKTETGQTVIKLLNGETFTADCYIPLFGIRLNNSWIPDNFLDGSGSVKLDIYMRVQGTSNIWGIGDMGNLEAKQVVASDAQIIHLAATLDLVLTERADKIKEHKPANKKAIFISLGKQYGTGQIGWWKVWGWMVVYIKGRNIFTDMAPNYVAGKQLRHASM